MSIKVNYHSHSCHSDGKHSPLQIVEHFYNEGVTHFALTDHDTIDGVIETQEAANKYNIKCYTGIEITACLNRKEDEYCHILGYDFDCELMEKALDEYYLGTDRTMNSTHQAIHLTPKKAIEAIHKAKGIAVLAHPFEIVCFLKYKLNEERVLKLVTDLMEYKIDGIEVYYQDFTNEEISYLNSIADKYNLIKGIGTDYHVSSFHKAYFDREIISGNTLHEVLQTRNR